jgi:cell division protein FtsQ
MRARRIAVRRDEGRRRLHRLAALGAVVALALAATIATRTPLLDVDRVEVSGATHTDVATILRTAGVTKGQPMTGVNVDGARSRLAALPWVASASVSKQWPGTVRIRLQERRAVAYVDGGSGRWLLVDTGAHVLESVPAPPAGLPVLAVPVVSGRQGSPLPAADRDLVRVAAALDDTLRPQVSAVGADGRGPLLALASCGLVLLGDTTELDAKLLATTTVLAQVDHTSPGRAIAVLDVRVPGAPVLTHDPNCATVSTTTGG